MTASSVKAAMFGVCAWGCPPNGSIQSLRSSREINRTFGFGSVLEAYSGKHMPKAKNSRMKHFIVIDFFALELCRFHWGLASGFDRVSGIAAAHLLSVSVTFDPSRITKAPRGFSEVLLIHLRQGDAAGEPGLVCDRCN